MRQLTKNKDFTIKQRKWLKAYIKTGNATEAAMRVYDCKDRGSAANVGWENVRKLDFSELMEESGLTDTLLNQKTIEGLAANKQLAARVIFKKEAPTSQSAGELPLANSTTDDFIEVPDYAIRHKYLETALKLKKRLDHKEDSNGNTVNINFRLPDGFSPSTSGATTSGNGVEQSTEVQGLGLAQEG